MKIDIIKNLGYDEFKEFPGIKFYPVSITTGFISKKTEIYYPTTKMYSNRNNNPLSVVYSNENGKILPNETCIEIQNMMEIDQRHLTQDKIPEIIIVVSGGMVQGVESNKPVNVVLVDWDNINEGDEFPFEPNVFVGEFENLENRLVELKNE